MNKVADALSRQPRTETEVTQSISAVDNEEVCPWYHRIYEAVEQQPEDNPDYCVRDGKLYRHLWEMTDPVTNVRQDPWKLCIPKPARQTVLLENHDEPTAGYFQNCCKNRTPILLARNVP